MAVCKFCGLVLVLLALCSIACGQTSTISPTATRTISSTTPAVTTPTVTPTSHSGHKNISTPPGNHSTPTTPANHSIPTTPGNSTVPPTKPGKSTVPPTKPGNHSTVTTHENPTNPEGHSDHESDPSKWVATGFAVVFGVTTVIMTVLYCRQRKIYRELEGDSSLSRLI